MKNAQGVSLFGYAILLFGSVFVAFPRLSVTDLPSTGWLFFVGFGAFVIFVLASHLEMRHIRLNLLLIVSSAVYGFLGYSGTQSVNALAFYLGPVFALCSFMIYQGTRPSETFAFTGGIAFTGWLSAVLFQLYLPTAAIASMMSGVIAVGLLFAAVSETNKNRKVAYFVLLLTTLMTLAGLSLYLWLALLHTVVLSFVLGGIGLALVIQLFLFPPNHVYEPKS